MATSNSCSNCGEPVQSRRPSHTGEHWCKRKACQSAKQRFYYARRNRSVAESEGALIRQLIHDSNNLERRKCSGCGLENAVPGWAHRNAQSPMDPCFGAGSLGPGLPPGCLDAVHPELVPSA